MEPGSSFCCTAAQVHVLDMEAPYCCRDSQGNVVEIRDREYARTAQVPIEIREREEPHESCDFVSSSKLWRMLSGLGGIFFQGCENVQPLRVIELPGGANEMDSAALLEDHAKRVPDDRVTSALMAVLKDNPQVLIEHQIVPASTGIPHCYKIDGREVRLEVASSYSYPQTSGLGGQISKGPNSPVLVCQDSVMRQPFLDYVFNTGYNEWYEDVPGAFSAPLSLFKEFPEPPPDNRMDRFDAMKLARQQALERERSPFYGFGIAKPPYATVNKQSPTKSVDLPNFMPHAGGA